MRLVSVSTPDPGIGAELKDTVEGGIVGYRVTTRVIGLIGVREA
jgi:hypothetical protein